MVFYRIGLVRILLYLCIMQSLALGLASANEEKDIAFWNSVYKENHVVQIHISANREAWDAMQPKKVERNPNGPKVHFGNKFGYAKANITIDGELFKDAGLRFKGGAARGHQRPRVFDARGRARCSLRGAFRCERSLRRGEGQELHCLP